MKDKKEREKEEAFDLRSINRQIKRFSRYRIIYIESKIKAHSSCFQDSSLRLNFSEIEAISIFALLKNGFK